MIHLVHLSEGKELPRFQHSRSTKTSNKFLNAWGKIISAETLLDENMCSKAVLLLWIFYVFVLSYVCYVFVLVCLYVLFGHLLGKG